MKNKRIEAIAQLISNDQSVIDIGCDHGYLAMALRDKGNEKLIICCDEKIGPLNNAKSNLKYFDNILYYCTDGVKDIDKQVQVAVMAGMGHNTVIHIMNDSERYFRNCKKIIIQVNHTVSSLRRFLTENNYKIINEVMIKDYKYYEILVVENGKQQLSEKQIEYGPIFLKEKSDLFKEFYQHKLAKIEQIISQLDKDHKDKIELEKKRADIIEMLSNHNLS